MPNAIDLFAGGGGLTRGLKRAGYSVISAVEIEQHAVATYKANHPEVNVFHQDIREINGDSLRGAYPKPPIHLLAGCPPCQGFTSLTAKYKRHDPRNDLIRDMTRLVEEIRPMAIMMENVPGLAKRGSRLLEEFKQQIQRLGYIVNMEVLQVADYGVPQNRRRIVLLAGLGYKIPTPQPTHSKDGKGNLSPWKTVREIIGELPEPFTLTEARKMPSFEDLNWHIIRSMEERNMNRLKFARPGKDRTDIPEEFRPNCHKGDYLGFGNVYGRMTWDSVAPAITGGCTTLSKGRFGHPEKQRTISVREAALLQTFPMDYKIVTPYMEYACKIIGNALPCDFAEVLAKECLSALKNNVQIME